MMHASTHGDGYGNSVYIQSPNANDAWWAALVNLRQLGNAQDGRDQETIEVLHSMFTIHDPRQRYIYHRPIDPAFSIAEIVWILAGQDDVQFLDFWNARMKTFSDDGEKLEGAYGYRLRQNLGIDQLMRAYRALKSNPNSRQVVLQIWNAEQDLPFSAGKPRSKDIPCNIMSHLLVRDGKLHWLQVMRSNDLIWGTPYNFIQWTTLQEVMAGWLGVDIGPYVHISDSLHVYKRHWKHMKSIKYAKAPTNVDDLRLPMNALSEYDTFNFTLYIMLSTIQALTAADTEAYARKVLNEAPVSQSWYNMLVVMAAEALRRNGAPLDAQAIISGCLNPALTTSWQNWYVYKENEDVASS